MIRQYLAFILEFKLEAASLTIDRCYSIPSTSKSLYVGHGPTFLVHDLSPEVSDYE